MFEKYYLKTYKVHELTQKHSVRRGRLIFSPLSCWLCSVIVYFYQPWTKWLRIGCHPYWRHGYHSVSKVKRSCFSPNTWSRAWIPARADGAQGTLPCSVGLVLDLQSRHKSWDRAWMSAMVEEVNSTKGARGMNTINKPWSPRLRLLISWILTRYHQLPAAVRALTSTNVL